MNDQTKGNVAAYLVILLLVDTKQAILLIIILEA